MNVLVLLVASSSLSCMGQGIGRPQPFPERSLLRVGDVNYWGAKRNPIRTEERSLPSQADVWTEPIRLPDGRFAAFRPASQVVQFLDDPSPERARDYLEWQRERVSKLRRAMEVLESISADEENAGASDTANRKDTPLISKPSGLPHTQVRPKLLLFKQAGCVYCDAQDRVLGEVRVKQPNLDVQDIAKGQSPDLWRKFSVTVTPTIVVLAGDKPLTTLRGLTSQERILSEIERAVTHEN